MPGEIELSIANLSKLSQDKNFLLQISRKSEKLSQFIKNSIPSNEKDWLADLKSWEISNKWLKDVSDICIDEYDQVFFDMGEELFDLKDAENYNDFRNRVLFRHRKRNPEQ